MNFLKKILLVDYNPSVTCRVRKMLEASGNYQLKEEHDSRFAFKTASWFQPDLILFDSAIAPAEAGAVARQLQADPALRSTPLVFLGVAPPDNGGVVSSGGVLGGYSFFASSLSIEDFVRYVRELLHPRTTRERQATDAMAR